MPVTKVKNKHGTINYTTNVYRHVVAAYGETPRVINIEMPGVCPYKSVCSLQSPSYSLKYHSDLREQMRYHRSLNPEGKGGSWGCAIGGHSMERCSSYEMLEKGWTHCTGPPNQVIRPTGWLKNDV